MILDATSNVHGIEMGRLHQAFCLVSVGCINLILLYYLLSDMPVFVDYPKWTTAGFSFIFHHPTNADGSIQLMEYLIDGNFLGRTVAIVFE